MAEKKKKKSGLPSRIECTKCGSKKGVRPDILEKRIAKFGTLKQLQDVYVCRSCKKEHDLDGAFRKKPAKRKYRKADERDYRRIDPHDGKMKYFWEHRQWQIDEVEKALARMGWPDESKQVEQVRYGPACMRPDLNTAQNNFCGTEKGEFMCPLYDLCDCPIKKLAKYPKLIAGDRKAGSQKSLLKKSKKKKK